MVDQSVPLALREFTLGVFAPIGNARVHVWTGEILLVSRLDRNNVLLLCFGHESLSPMKKPVVGRAIVALNAPLITLSSGFCLFLNIESAKVYLLSPIDS